MFALFLFTSVQSVEASVSTFSNRSFYTSAATQYGPATGIDFTTKDDGNYITNPGSDVYIDPLTLRGVSFNGARSYYNIHTYTFPSAFITANLPENTYAFGLDLSRFYGSIGAFTVILSTGDTYQITPSSNAAYFFGATSDSPIRWAKFSFDNDYIVLDNFTYSRNAPYNIADGDVTGLIAAINASNANPGPDIINLAPSGTYTLTYVAGPDSWHGPTGLPIVQGPSETRRESLTINGNGSTIQRSSAPGTPEFRIFHSLYAKVVLDGVVIRNGRVYGPNRCGGGGLYLNVSDTIIRNSTITENWADNGGGICNNNTSTLSIENSTISYNTGYGGRTGGGILNFSGGQLTISSSTVYENQAGGSPGFEGRGDAIADAFSPPGSTVIKNSIVASPTRGMGVDCVFFTPVSQGHNIFSDSSCGQNVAGGDLIVPILQLGPLTNNGGPTPTHALLSGSPAIDVVPLVDCSTIAGAPVSTDQRGFGRPVGTNCDIGAYEHNTNLSGLISYWPADGNADDVAGPNNGTLRNGATFGSGIFGQTFSLNGVNHYVEVLDSPSLSFTGPLTFGAMVRLNVNNIQQALIEKYDVPGRNGYYFRINPAGKLQAAVCNPSTCAPPAVGATTLALGAWHHVAAVYDGTSMKVYLDGVLDGSIPMNMTPTDGPMSLKIGARGDDAATRLNGFIDEIKLFNRALAVSEIVTLATTDSTPPAIVPTVTGGLGGDGWYTSDVDVVWEIVDAESSVTSSTGCGAAAVSIDTAGTTFTCSATSAGGTATQSVTVKRDATAPMISNMPANQTLEATGPGGAVASWGQPTATDALDPAPTLTCSAESGSTFGISSTQVVCSASDRAGNSTSASFTVMVSDTTPPTISNTPGNISVAATSQAGALVSWTAPAGEDAVDGNVAVSCTPPSGGTFAHGITTVNCTATDSRGNNSISQFAVEVANAAPTASAGGPYQVGEGGVSGLSGSGTDVENTTLSYAWDLDNNSSFETAGQNPNFSAAGIDGPSTRTIRLRVTDGAGLSSVASVTVNVTNVAPTLVSITGPTVPQTVNTTIELTINHSDPAGPLDQYTRTTEWGDGTTDSSTSHAYTMPGVYRVSAVVADDDGGISNQLVYEYIVVYDPNAGFVTGGGWIMSQAGAYIADPSLSGKATFGFVSKYQSGASQPTGNTEFQFQSAGFRFKSDSFEWLVIAGARAQYKGSGSVNGTPGHSFILTATDGQVTGGGGADKFRIKIWNAAGLVYDNVIGASDQINEANPQAIGGGSIIIHSDR